MRKERVVLNHLVGDLKKYALRGLGGCVSV
jgi:hypothetical protein